MSSKTKKRRKRPAKARRTPTEREETGATPETLRHFKEAPPAALALLIEKSWIDAAGEMAADEIRRCYEALTHEVDVKISKMSDNAHGVNEMPDAVAEAIATRYNPWQDDVGSHTADKVKNAICRNLYVVGLENLRDIADALTNYARRF